MERSLCFSVYLNLHKSPGTNKPNHLQNDGLYKGKLSQLPWKTNPSTRKQKDMSCPSSLGPTGIGDHQLVLTCRVNHMRTHLASSLPILSLHETKNWPGSKDWHWIVYWNGTVINSLHKPSRCILCIIMYYIWGVHMHRCLLFSNCCFFTVRKVRFHMSVNPHTSSRMRSATGFRWFWKDLTVTVKHEILKLHPANCS